MTLSDDDLDRIERDYVERVEYPPAVDDIAALVAEVRRLSAALDRAEDIASNQGCHPDGDGALLVQVVDECVAAVNLKADYSPADPS